VQVPQAMVGALAKTYYAEKMGLDPAKVYVVSVMPCTAKKFEIIRSKEMHSSGFWTLTSLSPPASWPG